VIERIYYTKPATLEFDATVLSCEAHAGRFAVTLDRTAFYPTSGGQPFDTGTLVASSAAGEGASASAASARVTDVLELEDGRIDHLTDRPLPAGARVHGVVDEARRRDHMQQHTGQHILSAAFDRLFKARTVGFHLGADVSTLDLDKALPPDSVTAAESEANRVVWGNRPVTIRFASEAEAAAIQLRKEPTRTGELRLVDVADFDCSACGGTHVAHTGEIGVIAVKAVEKFRGGLRITIVCGQRALAEYRIVRDAVAGCIRLISVSPGELPSAIERAQGENKDLHKTISDLQVQLAGFEAAAMVDRGVRVGETTVVIEVAAGWDQAGLKALATSAVKRGGTVAAMLSGTAPVLAVIARSADAPVDASAVLKALIARAGGKGGGKPDLAQGGGMTGTPEALQADLRSIIEGCLQPAP